MAVERMRVRLADIVPSKSNPRRDFGDIDALAAAIESTGGEPVNPPVLVADGNIYRIVDGERRYRALRKLHGDDTEVAALVYDSMDEANEVVAMLATDDKRPLTEAERAHGVQQMLLLGVDTERVAKASRATRGQLAACRMMSGRVPEGRQVTLDQMVAASELPDDMAAEVLDAGENWQGTASRLRAEAAKAERVRIVEEARAACGGIELVGNAAGLRYAGFANVGSAEETAAAVAQRAAEGCTAVTLSADAETIYFHDALAEKDGPDAEEKARIERECREDLEVCRALTESVISFVLAGGVGPVPCEVFAPCAEWLWEKMPWTLRHSEHAKRLHTLAAALGRSEDAVGLMLADYALGIDGLLNRCGSPVPWSCRRYCKAYDMACLCGWEPTAEMRGKRLWAGEHLPEGDE